MKVLYQNTAPTSLMAESLQANLNMAGFHVDLVPALQQIFWELPRKPELRQAQRMGPGAEGLERPDCATATAAAPYNRFYDHGTYRNLGGYSSPLTDSLINKALASPSVARWLPSTGRRPNARVNSPMRPLALAYENQAVYHSSAVHGCIYWWGDGTALPNV